MIDHAEVVRNTYRNQERERILAILQTMPSQFNHNDSVVRAIAKSIALIKETKNV